MVQTDDEKENGDRLGDLMISIKLRIHFVTRMSNICLHALTLAPASVNFVFGKDFSPTKSFLRLMRHKQRKKMEGDLNHPILLRCFFFISSLSSQGIHNASQASLFSPIIYLLFF